MASKDKWTMEVEFDELDLQAARVLWGHSMPKSIRVVRND